MEYTPGVSNLVGKQTGILHTPTPSEENAAIERNAMTEWWKSKNTFPSGFLRSTITFASSHSSQGDGVTMRLQNCESFSHGIPCVCVCVAKNKPFPVRKMKSYRLRLFLCFIRSHIVSLGEVCLLILQMFISSVWEDVLVPQIYTEHSSFLVVCNTFDQFHK